MMTQIHAETPEELIAHIARLMDEVEAMLAGPAVGVDGGEMQSRLAATRTKFGSLYRDARKTVATGAKLTHETILAYPYEALAVALSVGVLVGACFLRRRE